ncbi:MAG: response regulator transcription factor [Oligoflexia bacterium]|nr:response regulator transcription factor [Oligoflexia bacterium]
MTNVNVLIVDDDQDLLRVVQKILEANGYTVTTALNPIEGMDKFLQESFDLVLSDANMPYKSGFELIKTIRSHTHAPHVAIALLTGRRDKKDVQHGLDCGADDYIIKPVDPDLFIAKVESLLRKRPPQFKAEVNFAESPVRMPAQWDIANEIVSVSEQSITIVGPVATAPNSKMKIESPLFDIIGIETPTMRVVHCNVKTDARFQFLTKATFIGLTDSERQKIRFWVNAHTGIHKSAKSS